MSTRERQRSGGRSEQVRASVATAVLGFLAQGRVGFSAVEIAQRAGVSRATLYRWWPTHADLLAEALAQHTRQLDVPDTGDWARDVRSFAHAVARFAADPVELAMARSMASGQHPEFNRAVVANYAPVVAALNRLMDRAPGAQQVAPTIPASTLANTLMAPLFLGPLMTGSAVPPADVDAVVDLIVAAVRPATGATARTVTTLLPG